MPTECTPIASTPVIAPSPKIRKKMMASTTSGTARTSTITVRAPNLVTCPGVVLPAARIASGTLMTTDSSVADTTIARVCPHSVSSSPSGGKSRGSIRPAKSAALRPLSMKVATLIRRSATAR